VLLFFAEDLHGFYAGGAKRGEEGGGCGDDENEQDDGQECGKIRGGNAVEKPNTSDTSSEDHLQDLK
jgi:hypothetical protein